MGTALDNSLSAAGTILVLNYWPIPEHPKFLKNKRRSIY
jgi:hypothetical protein